MTGFYLKEKRLAGGDFKSEEDIGKIHWKWFPPAFFFFFLTFRNNFVPFLQSGKCVQWREGRREGSFFMLVWSAKDVIETNWQSVNIYLSCCRTASMWRRKTDPLLIQPGLRCTLHPHPPPPPLLFRLQDRKQLSNCVSARGPMTWDGL